MISDQMNDVGSSLDEFRGPHDILVKQVIDRGVVAVSDTFVPSAEQFFIVDDVNILFFADPKGGYGVRRWRWFGGLRKNLFEAYLPDDGHWFSLRAYGALPRYSRLWALERRCRIFGTKHTFDVLALNSTPILFEDPTIAKQVAQTCHPNPREEAARLRWVPLAE